MTFHHPLFAQVQLSLSEKDNGNKSIEQLIQAMVKVVKGEALDFMHAFDTINGYQTIRLQEETNETIIRAMRTMETTQQESLQPVRVFIEKNGHHQMAHSFIRGTFTKKTQGSLHKIDHTFRRIVDLNRLFAETLVLNKMEQFARNNEALLRYLVTSHIAHNFINEATPLPLDGKFSFDLVKSMKAFGFLRDKTIKYHQIDAYKTVFYAEKNEQGYLQGVEHPLMQEILVPEWLKQMVQVKEERVRRKAEHTTYSKSFQTKKNIRKATQAKMETNAFLSHYGFVEIDNTVPLETFRMWEEAFVQLNTQVLIPKAPDHSLRIRRLGKQKATGMYYATAKATVLDLDSPCSYAHELGHQIDHTQATSGVACSKEFVFRPILDLYKVFTTQQVALLDENDPFRHQWEGKGKYNRHYYWMPTEIFARSFELYLVTKGVTSLLLKEDVTRPVYPDDPRYIEQICHYFDHLLAEKK